VYLTVSQIYRAGSCVNNRKSAQKHVKKKESSYTRYMNFPFFDIINKKNFLIFNALLVLKFEKIITVIDP